MGAAFEVRPYRAADERGWVVCRVLSFLDSAFFDDVRQSKEHYEHPAIELVAERGGEIVGLIDVECEEEPGTVCEARPGLGGMIWHLAVHPDHQRHGMRDRAPARGRAPGEGARASLASKRGRATTSRRGRGTRHVASSSSPRYLHVYVELDEGLRSLFPVTADGLRPVRVFAHYVGDERDDVRRRFARVHENVLYERCVRMTAPDLELVAQAIGNEPRAWRPHDSGGYTRSRAWRVETVDGPVFVKQAEEPGPLHMLRREAVVYRSVRGAFVPGFVGFADAGDRALLAVEFLEDAAWPPPYPEDVGPLFDALELVADATPPPDLPAHGPWRSRWERVAADPEPFLGLGLCSPPRLAPRCSMPSSRSPPPRSRRSSKATRSSTTTSTAGTSASRAAVPCSSTGERRFAARGGSDVAFALLSVRVEGAAIPRVDFPSEADFAAAIAGHFAMEAPAPLPDWAEPGSTLREDMAGDLAHALRWVVELLELPPIT